ncbi:hypothetical protein BD410DRAFT_685902, partial [Rickenella mellea]
LDTIRTAFNELGGCVRRALHTQLGDRQRLIQQREAAVQLLQAGERVRDHHLHSSLIPAEEYAIFRRGIQEMIDALDQASIQSHDSPDAPPPLLSISNSTGQRGRPRIDLNREFLEAAANLRGTSDLAKVFHCSSRTVRRRMLDYGLSNPGVPVYIEYEADDGNIVRFYNEVQQPPNAAGSLSDNELDIVIRQILEIFPTFGRSMITGHLRYLGHQIPRERIRASYMRVVFHAFIDGYSRFITGIRASNNNRAQTVLDLFLDIIEMHGVPSRV